MSERSARPDDRFQGNMGTARRRPWARPGVSRWTGCSISYVASLFLVSATRQDFQEPRAARRSHFVADVAEAARWLWAQPFLRTALLLVGASNLAFAGVTLAAVVVAKNQGSSPFVVGLMLAFGGFGGMLGAIAAPHLRRRSITAQGHRDVDPAVVERRGNKCTPRALE